VKPLKTVEIFGVNIHCVGRDEILSNAIFWAGQSQPRTILYVNAHCLNISTIDPSYRAIINRADLVYPDGISAVWASRWMGGCELEKVTGRVWIDEFCQLAVQNGLKIFIMAGKSGIARVAKRKLVQSHPQIQIVGARDGFFSELDEEGILKEINQTRPDVLFIGMGTPIQEKWVTRNRQRIGSPVCWVVGALFDYVAGEETPVPAWMDKYALEWLWRLTRDPVGKWRRVIIGIPEFLIRFIISRLQTKRKYMPSVLFICTGNIHRSPMAEAVFKAKAAETKKTWKIESAGTWAPKGEPASHEVQMVMNKVGLDVSTHRSRLVNRRLLHGFNLILTMEGNHKEALMAEFPEVTDRIFMLSEMVGENRDVDDPIGGPLVDFVDTAREIDTYLSEGFEKICQLAE